MPPVVSCGVHLRPMSSPQTAAWWVPIKFSWQGHSLSSPWDVLVGAGRRVSKMLALTPRTQPAPFELVLAEASAVCSSGTPAAVPMNARWVRRWPQRFVRFRSDLR